MALRRLTSASSASFRRCTIAATFALVLPRAGRAEDAVSYKYQDYRESAGRIAVQVHSALIEKDIGTAMSVKASGVVDTIAGATPNGQPPSTPGGRVPMSQLHEKRKAWTMEFSRQFSRAKLAIGAAGSREGDYISKGGSLNASVDFNGKNTMLAAGVSATDDDVKVFYRVPWERKRGLDAIVGVNQLLDPRTAVTANLTFSHASGYLSDPYKLVFKNTEVIPGIFLPRTFGENRPNARDKWIGLIALNRAYFDGRSALDASYRLFRDDFGIFSHTVNVEWFQKLGERLVLRPHVRYFVQSAADFYRVTLSGTTIVPERVPTGRGPFYSADYRLAELDSLDYGLKAVWTPFERLQIDLALARYVMTGRDGGMTSDSAFPRATVFTTGVRFAF